VKGASGAFLSAEGDFVRKTCSDAKDQVHWFQHATKLGLSEGVRVPFLGECRADSYFMEFIRGHSATQERSTFFLEKLVEQINLWSNKPAINNAEWSSYLARLESHVELSGSIAMGRAYEFVSAASPFPSSFCHGDLTLENVLMGSDEYIVLIDPNYSDSLFQSHILDFGKLLQSTHAKYHEVFDSNCGVSLRRHKKALEKKLKALGVWEASITACVSHIIRLRKYQPRHKHKLVDAVLVDLLAKYS